MVADRRTEAALALVPLALAALTFVILANPSVDLVIRNERLALAIDVVAISVAIAVTALGWVRYRDGGDQVALWRGSALLVLGAMNMLTALPAIVGVERGFGLSLDDPGQFPLWATILAREVAAVLFVTAGLTAIGRWQSRWLPPVLVLWLPALVTTTAAIVALAFQDALPPLITEAGLQSLQADPTRPLTTVEASPLILMEILVALAYLAAAALSYRAYRVNARGTDAVLAVGLLLAAFSQVLFAVYPSAYSSLVGVGDVLRVSFYGMLLAILAIEVRGDLRALRAANVELTRLRDAEVARATAEERARLAREIHDGMSQELWYAKLKQGRLLQGADLSADARGLASEVAAAIESALAEARQAIMALRPAEGTTFTQVLERYVEDFADRFGIPADCVCDPALERLPARAQAEVLRIVQEALNNARKHADATRVHVEASAGASGLRLTIADNGHGFNVDQPTTGYGLRSMRERAALMGATIQIESQAQGGTRVVVELPSPAGA